MTTEKILMLDTETTNDIDDPICYDIGCAIIDKEGNAYEDYSFVVKDVFFNKELMESAYFKEKIPQYLEEIKEGKREPKSWYEIRLIIRNLMQKYNTTYVSAHNVRFDYRSTATTQRYLTKSKYRFFFPYGTQFLDTLKMAREIFARDDEYIAFCKENEYLCKNGKPRYTAEILYRYLNKDNDFIEEHTALEDVLIEKMILAECYKRNPEINGLLWS